MGDFFLKPPSDLPEQVIPDIVYASLDTAELIGGEGTEILAVWDAVDAAWFDENCAHLAKGEFLDQVPIFQFEIRLNAWTTDLTALRRHVQSTMEAGYDDSIVWFRVEFGPQPVETPATFYSSLLGPGTARFINSARSTGSKKQNQLTQAFSLDDIADASMAEIEDFLDAIGSISHVLAYDVGQGASIGLCDSTGAVRLYSDVGAGTRRNRGTFPNSLKSFCFGESPNVLLSHWDSDHWAAAVIDPRFTTRSWLVPRQKMRPSHRKMAHEITKNGRLLVWPSGTPAIKRGQAQVENCTGRDRNGSGLAVTVWRDAGGSVDPVLIPGDADYSKIPSFTTGASYFSTVVPHHGAKLVSAHVPRPTDTLFSRATYSFGLGNTHRHPHASTVSVHHGAGWTDATIVPGATTELCRRTADRCPTRHLGHTLVAWNPAAGLPATACAGLTCQLGATQ